MSLTSAKLRFLNRLKWWLALAMGCAAITGAGTAIKVAGRRVDALEAQRGRIASAVERKVWADITRDKADTIFPIVSREHVYTTTERRIVDISGLDPQFAGWKARITSGDRWHAVSAIPPSWPQGFVFSLGSESTRHLASQARKLILILCAMVWSVAFVLIPLAGPWRQKIARFCVATALLALATWASNDIRPRILSFPALDWIACISLAGLLTGIIAVAIPTRRAANRPGRCGACDYDLTGNVSGVCPECGCPTPAEIRRRRDERLAPLAQAIQGIIEPMSNEEPISNAEVEPLPNQAQIEIDSDLALCRAWSLQ